MKKEYFEPEFDKLTIITSLMSNIDLSTGEDDKHIGYDGDENENIGGN